MANIWQVTISNALGYVKIAKKINNIEVCPRGYDSNGSANIFGVEPMLIQFTETEVTLV